MASAQPDRDTALWSAWIVRQHVLEHVQDARDVVALGLAFPAALGSPSLQRLPQSSGARHATVELSGALVLACAEGRSRDVAALAARPFSLGRALAAADTRIYCYAFARSDDASADLAGRAQAAVGPGCRVAVHDCFDVRNVAKKKRDMYCLTLSVLRS
eukprot:m51a1_g9248 hypothetical protein (159) ;mRNA; f:10595-12826